MVTVLNSTLSPAVTVATRNPLLLNTSALAGILSGCTSLASASLTLAKAPGRNSPLGFSIESCMRVVPDDTSTDCADASMVAGNVRPAYSGTVTVAFAPILMPGK